MRNSKTWHIIEGRLWPRFRLLWDNLGISYFHPMANLPYHQNRVKPNLSNYFFFRTFSYEYITYFRRTKIAKFIYTKTVHNVVHVILVCYLCVIKVGVSCSASKRFLLLAEQDTKPSPNRVVFRVKIWV